MYLPSPNLKTPAKVRAVISPTLKPAVAIHDSKADGRSSLSFSKPAKEQTTTAGWQYFVWSSWLFGPFSISLSKSYFKMAFAASNISQAVGYLSSSLPMPTYCEPCPGNSRIEVSDGSTLGRSDFIDWDCRGLTTAPTGYGEVRHSSSSSISSNGPVPLAESSRRSWSLDSFSVAVPLSKDESKVPKYRLERTSSSLRREQVRLTNGQILFIIEVIGNVNTYLILLKNKKIPSKIEIEN